VIRQTCANQAIGALQLAIYGDRSSSMTAKLVAFLLADLGVTHSQSSPHVSDDKALSESHFRALSYRPDFPGHFDPIEAAPPTLLARLRLVQRHHHYGGLGLHTPADIHYGIADYVVTRTPPCSPMQPGAPRTVPRKPPEPPHLPTGSWINPPEHPRGAHSVHTTRRCLIQADNFPPTEDRRSTRTQSDRHKSTCPKLNTRETSPNAPKAKSIQRLRERSEACTGPSYTSS
jgi:hypothetical protein